MKKTELQYKVGRIGRRRFLTAMTATGTVAATPLWGGVSPGNSSPTAPLLDPKALEGKPWKLDVTIYDRPGWTSTTYALPVIKRENNELVVGFQAQREDTYTDDFYSAHAEWVFLSSKNGGKSWDLINLQGLPLDPRWADRSAHCAHGWPVQLPDGTLINVVEDAPTRQAQKERLEKVGLGHLWYPDSTFGWDLWPASHAERLKEEGMHVFSLQWALPPGVVATHNRQPVVTVSHDGGRSWEERLIEGLPKFSHFLAWFRRGIALPDGTVLGVIYGVLGGMRGDTWRTGIPYALRSNDKGETWQISPLVQGPTGKHSFSETDLLLLPSGRILAVIRRQGPVHLYQSYSDDGGKSWSQPVPTPIHGQPGNLLRLKSGNILCVYRVMGALGRKSGYAGRPVGYRGVLSYDEGKTWDVANEKVIRDDTLPGLVGYPSSVQLDDGTIFTLYNVLRVDKIKPEDNFQYKENLLVHPPLHSYIAGSLYTEDYIRPPG